MFVRNFTSFLKRSFWKSKNIFKWLLSKVLSRLGFSITELITTLAVAGTLSVVGIRGYKSQTNKARSAEAKKSLSFLYTEERSFHQTWGTYHENLMVIGAVPSGSYYYDVGFGKSTAVDDGSGTSPLSDYPLTDILNLRECTNFHQICNGDCPDQAELKSQALRGTTYSAETVFSRGMASCRVTGGVYVKDHTGSYANYGADATTFKAFAISQLQNQDVWEVDHNKLVSHVQDGTN